MTAIAGRRVDAAVDCMPGKIIPAVRHAAVVSGLVLDGWLQLDSDPVAITAITLPMTCIADGAEPAGHRAMVFPKKQAVVEFLKGNFRFLSVMAIRAEAQIFALLIRVPGRRCITALHSGTSSQQHDQSNTYAYSQQFITFHTCLPDTQIRAFTPVGMLECWNPGKMGLGIKRNWANG
jgi:hypothetical protein